MKDDCGCENGKKRVTRVLGADPDAAKAQASAEPAREASSALACVHCLDMHLAYALELAYEPAAADELSEERFLLVGTLRAAQDHAAALGRHSLAQRIRALRLSLAGARPAEKVPPFVRTYIDERRAERTNDSNI